MIITLQKKRGERSAEKDIFLIISGAVTKLTSTPADAEEGR